MSQRILALLMALLVLLLAFSGVASAAGDSHANPTPITEGTYTGAVVRYAPDWYKIAVPEGKALHVAFTVTAGHDWTDILLVNSEATTLGRVSSGATGAYDPDESEAWLKVEDFWGPANYTFTVSFINVAPQNDANSGMDAGQRRSNALAVAPGRIAGAMSGMAGDLADWYRLEVPAGHIVDVHDTTTWLDILDADGRVLASLVSYNSSFYPRSYTTVADGRPIFFRMSTYASSSGLSYAFFADVSLPGDAAVTALDVREVEIVTPAGPTELSPQREVVVTLSNVGAGATRAAHVELRTTHEGITGSRLVQREPVALGPGEQVTLILPWDTTGQLGEFKLIATVTNDYDVDVADNVASVDTYLVVGGAGMGVDALNHVVQVGATVVAIEHGGERTGVATPAGFVGWAGGRVVVGG